MDLIIFVALLSIGYAKGQFFEDRRCRCVCPIPASVVNTTTTRQIFTANVPPNQCDCEGVVFPLLRKELEGKLHIFCPRCECVYQTRNTTLIMDRRGRSKFWMSFAIRRMKAWLCRFVKNLAYNVGQAKAVVFFTLTSITMAILYMLSLHWLKALIFGTNNRRGERNQNQQQHGQHEVDHVREYRGEYERQRARVYQDVVPDSDEEELLMWAEDS